MDSEQLASMYAEVVRGVPVEASRFAISDEDRAEFRVLQEQVAEIRRTQPGVVFEIPNEFP